MTDEEIRKRVEEIFNNAEETDYNYIGDDEYPFVTFDKEAAMEEVLKLIKLIAAGI